MVVISSKLKMKKSLKQNLSNATTTSDNELLEQDDQVDDGKTDQTESEKEQIPRETLVIMQEVNIARVLAGNDAIKRNRQVRKLRRWLQLRAKSSFPFTEENFMRLWKGLYYNMWMSDKPLVQEQLAEQLAQLLECFEGNVVLSANFFGAFLKTMRNEWFGIDQWRMDKFLMLMRRMLRSMFRVLKAADWDEEAVKIFNEHAEQNILTEKGCSKGLIMHYMDIIFEELAKVAEGEINSAQVTRFVHPFIDYFVTQTDNELLSHCRERIFHHLLYQSALGREYQEKYAAWKNMGFPTASIDALEKIEAGDSELEEENDQAKEQKTHLDPRAGNVDVFVPELPLDGAPIIECLQSALHKLEISAKRRKLLKTLLKHFELYESGKFPLGVQTMPQLAVQKELEQNLIKEQLEEVQYTEEELYGVGRKLKQLNKRKRRKLLKSLNYENVQPDELDDLIESALQKPKLQTRREQARQSLMSGWLEEELDEETENVPAAAQLPKKQNKLKKHFEKLKLKRQLKKSATENKPEEEATPSKVPKVTVQQDGKNESPAAKNGWEVPLSEGEVEYFIPSRQIQVKKANQQLVRNPLAQRTPLRGKSLSAATTPKTPNSAKRVKIALKLNTAQKPSDYIQQILNSPNVPYDASRKPSKGLLKPNCLPTPVDPFYVKRHSLKLHNNTF